MQRFLLTLSCLLIITVSFSQTTYRFTGSGNWNIAANWSNNTVPPSPLPGGDTIYIATAAGGNCILNVPQVISPGGSLIISADANFIISEGMLVNNNIVTAEPSVTICSNVWMKKNLTVSAYRNGDLIPQITDANQFSQSTTGAWCWYNNDSVNYSEYGKLYNWYAVNDPRGLAPAGWRVPNTSDINALVTCYGNLQRAGSAMKETGNTHWLSSNTDANNISGFSALPGGQRFYGSFSGVGEYAYFWQSEEEPNNGGKMFFLSYNNAWLFPAGSPMKIGHSVRCVKDTVFSTINLPVVTTNNITAIENTTAVSGGNITSDGGYPIIARGIVWDTIDAPTITDGQTIDGTGTGTYISNLSALKAGKVYYVRAYARNQFGCSYGNTISFTTAPPTLPVLSTGTIFLFFDTAAYGGGKLIDDGGSTALERGVVFSTHPLPTIADNKAFTLGGIDSFLVKFFPLTPGTTYYVRTYAINEAGTGYGNEVTVTTAPSDPGGNLVINNQVWMPKNLDVSVYRNGDTIPQVTDMTQWSSLTTGAWCWYNNDSASYAATYGKLYNFYAVADPRGLAPVGWHIPNEAEWITLADAAGGAIYAAVALKESGNAHWQFGGNGTNITGFTALPNGARFPNNADLGLTIYAHWWGYDAATGAGHSVYLSHYYSILFIDEMGGNQKRGYGVRCVKD